MTRLSLFAPSALTQPVPSALTSVVSGGEERGGAGYSLQGADDKAGRLEQGILHTAVQEVR